MKCLYKVSAIFLAVFLGMFVCGCGQNKTEESLEKANEKGLLLAYIKGEPFYCDPINYFKLTGYALAVNPGAEDKKKVLFAELMYLEGLGTGKTMSKEWLEAEIQQRKYTAKVWQSIVDNPKKAKDYIADVWTTKEEVKVYCDRYMELYSQCLAEYGNNENAYYKGINDSLEKYYVASLPGSAKMEGYAEQVKNGELTASDFEETMYADFPELLEKYNVKIVNKELLQVI